MPEDGSAERWTYGIFQIEAEVRELELLAAEREAEFAKRSEFRRHLLEPRK